MVAAWELCSAVKPSQPISRPLENLHTPKCNIAALGVVFSPKVLQVFSSASELAAKLRAAIRHEGQYLLRSNLSGQDPALLWQQYVRLTEIEAAFRNLKGDLGLRPIFHHTDPRIEAHIFVAFLAYCLQVTLQQRLRALAPGLTPRAVMEKLSAIQMVDVYLPTTDGRILILPRYTQPEQEHMLLLQRLHLTLPPQPPPRICQPEASLCSEDL